MAQTETRKEVFLGWNGPGSPDMVPLFGRVDEHEAAIEVDSDKGGRAVGACEHLHARFPCALARDCGHNLSLLPNADATTATTTNADATTANPESLEFPHERLSKAAVGANREVLRQALHLPEAAHPSNEDAAPSDGLRE